MNLLKKQTLFYFGIICSLILSACTDDIVCDISVEACELEIQDKEKNSILYTDSLKVFHFNEKGEKEVVPLETIYKTINAKILILPAGMTFYATKKKNVFLQFTPNDMDTISLKSSSKDEFCKPITIDSVWYNGVLCSRLPKAHFLAIKK
jgi:hypothetical protein